MTFAWLADTAMQPHTRTAFQREIDRADAELRDGEQPTALAFGHDGRRPVLVGTTDQALIVATAHGARRGELAAVDVTAWKYGSGWRLDIIDAWGVETSIFSVAPDAARAIERASTVEAAAE